ncbi:hypothetical protein EDD15DRAFT_2573122 [Pisolithus albus]|nr:hypothetical protein EDD15DRAFT_2573122 [Pisolithus albus]
MVSDNCCAIRNAVLTVFPQVNSIQDVWHFIARCVPALSWSWHPRGSQFACRAHCCPNRYLATIMNASKNPLRSAVMANITNAVLKKHARDGDRAGAEYYSWHEQEQQLVSAYDKWSENGTVWSAASLKVHQEQLKHVWKGCLERRRQDVLSDGSHIEGCHKAWNALQHAQPSRLVMLTALSHDFVLRRNLRIAFERAKLSPSAALSAHGSHHLRLSSAIANLFNQLRASEPGCQLPPIAQLHAADSGETFGLVESEHSRTFGGLLKEEPAQCTIGSGPPTWEIDTDNLAEEALSITQDVLFNEWHIDPKLLDQPANPSSQTSPAMATTPADTTSTTQRRSRNVPGSGQSDSLTATAVSDRSQVTLDSFFRISSAPDKMQGPTMPATNPPAESRRLEPVLPALPALDESATAASPPNPESHASCLRPDDLMTALMAVHGPPPPPPPTNLSTRRVQCIAGKTRSQQIFSIATGIPPESLTVNGEDEFYLFMEMRAEFGWLSYQMTSRKWVDATNEYNRRLVLKLGPAATKKNPQALLRLLSRIECRLIEHIVKGDYKSKRNSEVFWRRHCSVIQLIKVDPSGKKPRKVPTCSRCQTIMYPGPEKAAINHKRGVCVDGVRSKPKEDEALPLWPQPQGVFSGGTTFHVQAFLNTVKAVYDQFIGGYPFDGSNSLLILEAQAFSAMLKDRTIITGDDEGPPMALFQLYPGFEVDSSTPDGRIIKRDHSKWLRISFLEEDLKK